MTNWFDVDRNGLRKLIDHKSKAFVLHELLQNCWDTEATTVAVRLARVAGRPQAEIEVEDDDPNGFAHLEHAWTLFAESAKKSDPTKRGRYNLGEKLVLALCLEAEIQSTTGSVVFDDSGRHRIGRTRRAKGSLFRATLRMTAEEYAEVCQAARHVIPPGHAVTTFNGEPVPARKPIQEIVAVALPTVIADEEGFLRRTIRQTTVSVYEPLAGETPSLYELGIPVVETGDKWHLVVHQKIPLNVDRDNVTPAYLRQLRTMVVQHMAAQLTAADASATFVSEALASPDLSVAAVKRVVELRFGPKAAIFDPSDTEANDKLGSEGYTLIHGPQLSKAQWDNVRRAGVVQPAGQIAPTPRAEFTPGGRNTWIKYSDMAYGMRAVVDYSESMALLLLGKRVTTGVINDPLVGWNASYGEAGLVYNAGRLGLGWFEQVLGCVYMPAEINRLLLHELAHDREGNHRSDNYHRAVCELAAQLVDLALSQPHLLQVPRED
jgi:hypothetical protein